MTMIYQYYPKCFYCKKQSEHGIVLSTYSFDSDLDFRPVGRARLAIKHWIQRCPKCGYCAPKIYAWYTERDAEIIKSEEYRAQLNNPDYPELANSFLCFAMIMEKTGNYLNAGVYTHYAVWACDDAMNLDSSRSLRIRVLNLFDRVPEKSFKIQLIEIDLLRRAGLFGEALKRCEELLNGPVDLSALNDENRSSKTDPLEEQIKIKKNKYRMHMNILRFQKKLIEEKDASCHTIEEAMGNEPRTKIYI